jgi:hypothetical protein
MLIAEASAAEQIGGSRSRLRLPPWRPVALHPVPIAVPSLPGTPGYAETLAHGTGLHATPGHGDVTGVRGPAVASLRPDPRRSGMA